MRNVTPWIITAGRLHGDFHLSVCVSVCLVTCDLAVCRPTCATISLHHFIHRGIQHLKVTALRFEQWLSVVSCQPDATPLQHFDPRWFIITMLSLCCFHWLFSSYFSLMCHHLMCFISGESVSLEKKYDLMLQELRVKKVLLFSHGQH